MSIQDTSYKYNYLIPTEKLEFPVKVNVHFPCRGNFYFKSIELNKKILEITKSEVSFQASSFHIPHTTLYMGFVETFPNLMKTLEIVGEFAKAQKQLEIKLSKPYIKMPQNNWVFYDVMPVETIKLIKSDLREKIGKYMAPLSWDVVAETPHITIGYVKSNQDQVNKLLEQEQEGYIGTAEAVEVSFSGARGTCLGSIRTYELIK